MSTPNTTTRRPRGTGSLLIRTNSQGEQTYHGKWRDANGKQYMKVIGLVRPRGTSDGLTKSDAARALQTLMQATPATPKVSERMTVADAGRKYIEHLQNRKGLKPTTLSDYRLTLDVHLSRFFVDRHGRPAALDSIKRADVERYVDEKLARNGDDRKARLAAKRLAPKTINNHLNFLFALFRYACDEDRQWASRNPVAGVDRPGGKDKDAPIDLQFLTIEQLHAVIAAVPDDPRGPVDRAMYLTAAMTGLRQGELIALRWRDVDWAGSAIRVRRSRTHGETGSPKNGKERTVPMAPQVTGALHAHFVAQGWASDAAALDGLVFADPLSRRVTRTDDFEPFYDAAKMRRRFYKAAECADVPRIVFHELRHTFGTTCARGGQRVRDIQEWMGHAELKTTEIYMHYAPRAEAAADIGRAFTVDTPDAAAIMVSA